MAQSFRGRQPDVISTLILSATVAATAALSPSPAMASPSVPPPAVESGALVQAPIVSGQDAESDMALYRVVLIRAAPGRLLDLIELYQREMGVFEAETSERPYLFRHSQGDQWDLMLLAPLGESTSYSVEGSADALQDPPDDLVAWREELLVRGPESGEVHQVLEGAGFLHVEMFVALPGKRGELLEQRRMENDFLGGIHRPQNLIFTRSGGASWDLFTLGAYRDLQHFAESSDVTDEEQQRVAVAAGFEGADRIGTYLRTLIGYHHDTLAVMVR
jgi:hypothetical protein